MIILPLGLGNRVPRIPYLTLTITLISTAISIHYFKIIRDVEDSPQMHAVIESQSKVVEEYCPTYGLRPQQCAFISDILQKKNRKNQKATHVPPPKMTTAFEDLNGVTQYLYWINRQLIKPTDEEFLKSDLYQGFANSRDDLKTWISEEHSDLLSEYSFTFKSLFLAQFIHGNWLHLIGNFLTFLAFGLFLEQRVGPFAFLGIYFIGGLWGLIGQLYLLPNPNLAFILGASANISAIMGAFFVLFMKSKMKCLVTFIFWNKIYRWPTGLMVPLLYVGADLSGVLGGTSNVAHGAHLIGFMTGMAVGYMIMIIAPLPAPYLYPTEQELHHKLKALTNPDGKISMAHNILRYNSDNVAVMADTFEGIFSAQEKTSTLTKSSEDFLRKMFEKFSDICWNSKGLSSFLIRVSEKIPLTLDTRKYLAGLKPSVVLGLANKFAESKNWLAALRFYDLYLGGHPSGSQWKTVDSNADKILAHLAQTGTETDKIKTYVEHQPQDSRIRILSEKYFKFGGEEYVKSVA